MGFTYSSLPNFLIKETSCSPGTSLTYTKTLESDRDLFPQCLATYLPRVVLQNILNVLDRLLQILKTRVLFVLQLILEFGNELRIA